MASKKTIVGKINPEVLAFTTGKDPVLDLALIEADCIGSAAHVSMLSRMTIKPVLFTAAQKNKVIKALVEIMFKGRAGKFAITVEDQDVHLAVERVLTEKLGDLGKRIHTARSRNDQVALDLRLYAKEQLLAAMDEATTLAAALLSFAKKNVKVPMVGRTHLQPAMPSSVGLWASAHAESLLDDVEMMSTAYRLNNRCPLGSAAGYGVPVEIDRKLTSKLLAFDAPVHNVLYASNARGKIESIVLSALSQAMITLSRLAEDLILYSMPEFGYFSLPAEYCTGSSIMPQKKNPDVLELVRAKASKVLASGAMVSNLLKGLAGGYNRDLQEAKEPFMEGIQTTRSCLRIMALLVEGLAVRKEALAAGFTPSVFAADWALELVAKGEAFRDAYNYVRDHLDDLKNVDAGQALSLKTHLGAPCGLDFKLLGDMCAGAKKSVKQERAKYHSAVTKLLGVSYPCLC